MKTVSYLSAGLIAVALSAVVYAQGTVQGTIRNESKYPLKVKLEASEERTIEGKTGDDVPSTTFPLNRGANLPVSIKTEAGNIIYDGAIGPDKTLGDFELVITPDLKMEPRGEPPQSTPEN